MGKVRITLLSSIHGRKPKQRKTALALGLRKPRQAVELTDNPQVRGMIAVISHLVQVEQING